ncbi:MAG: YybH family protein [Planctomycetota bacterium]
MKRLILTAAMVACGLATVSAAEVDRQAADEAAIRKGVDAYVAAFNQGDAKALAALWSPEAVYTNPISGEQVVGREAIEGQFAAIFEEKGIKLSATTSAIQFVSPNVAVEQGVATVTRPDQAAEESEYTAVYVKRDGQWLLDRVTEEDVPVVVSNYEHLKELEWMVGTWVDEDEQARIETDCQWTKNQNFITRSFTLSVADRIEMAGMQIVGWDPAAKQIRSWVFDSDGGFGEGKWTKKGDSWHIQAVGTLPDGSKSSSVNIITKVDDDTFTWQSVNRVVGGELQPNVDEVVVVRQKASE